MSEKRVDRGKWYHKLHQLQKRLFRSKNNEGHHNAEEDRILKSREHKLSERAKGKR